MRFDFVKGIRVVCQRAEGTVLTRGAYYDVNVHGHGLIGLIGMHGLFEENRFVKLEDIEENFNQYPCELETARARVKALEQVLHDDLELFADTSADSNDRARALGRIRRARDD